MTVLKAVAWAMESMYNNLQNPERMPKIYEIA